MSAELWQINYPFFGRRWIQYDTSAHQFRCNVDRTDRSIVQRGAYYMVYNLEKAEEEFACTESVTLSTHGDFRFLDNLAPLVDRWRGPISITLYAPGHDYDTTNEAIAYLRHCETDLIRKYVTFHVFFDQVHPPEEKHKKGILHSKDEFYNCNLPPPWKNVPTNSTYKAKHNLLYPINVARNTAKLAARTHFVFPVDIELYPSRNFVPSFLEFVDSNPHLFQTESRNVFVLPVFEIEEDEETPDTKTDLLHLLKTKRAIIFHQYFCEHCHKVKDSDKWVQTEETDKLAVLAVGKRLGVHQVWEPLFVCTPREPLWDERMTWEGQSDKMVQTFAMCLLDYNFLVLNNAFLVHKAGIKKKKKQENEANLLVQRSKELLKNISIELQMLYGFNDDCSIKYSANKVKSYP